jgi:hypothetical protein
VNARSRLLAHAAGGELELEPRRLQNVLLDRAVVDRPFDRASVLLRKRGRKDEFHAIERHALRLLVANRLHSLAEAFRREVPFGDLKYNRSERKASRNSWCPLIETSRTDFAAR